MSPLHQALMAPLTTSLTRDDCAPAVFLLAHAGFDSHALTVASEIYRSLPGGRGELVASALAQEAHARLVAPAKSAEIRAAKAQQHHVDPNSEASRDEKALRPPGMGALVSQIVNYLGVFGLTGMDALDAAQLIAGFPLTRLGVVRTEQRISARGRDRRGIGGFIVNGHEGEGGDAV